MSRWKNGRNSTPPLGETVLCFDAIVRLMFLAYRSGMDLLDATSNKPTDYQADWWRPLPLPPKVASSDQNAAARRAFLAAQNAGGGK